MSGSWVFSKNDNSNFSNQHTAAFREYASILSFTSRLLEIFFVIFSFLAAYYLKFEDLSLPQEYKVALILATLLVLLIFPKTTLYRSWRKKNWLHQVKLMTLAWSILALLLIVVAFFTKTSVAFSREWMITWWLMAWVMILSYRYLLTKFVSLVGVKGWDQKKVIIVGAGELGKMIVRNLATPSWSEYQVVGFVDDKEELFGQTLEGVPVKGTTYDLVNLIKQEQVDEVLVALPLSGASENIEKIQYELRHSTVAIRLVPDTYKLRSVNQSITKFAGFHVINLNETPHYGIYNLFKIVQDKILSLVIIILLSPLYLILACGVKLSSKGPVLYKQTRVSWNGESFTMYKFRSMPIDAENNSGPVWAKANENRATKFGTFLRRTSLDELPQFFNVLRGDMSIVGPRPERPHFVEHLKEDIPKYMQRHLVKAGITGWAQVNGWRGNTDLKKRIEHDIHYIENWSLLFDLKIILMTIFKGFINKNAY